MILKNKKIQYEVDNATQSLKLVGYVNISTNVITDFNGNIYELNENGDIGVQQCNFYYSENSDGTVNKSMSSIKVDTEEASVLLLDDSIKQIKAEIAKGV